MDYVCEKLAKNFINIYQIYLLKVLGKITRYVTNISQCLE